MSSRESQLQNADYWADQMQAVSRRRDRDSFMRIYDHFAPRVRLYLRGRGSPETVAEELAQEAMLRLWQHATLYNPARSNLSTWLFCIARNLHIDRVRRELCGVDLDSESAPPDENLICDFSSVEDHAERADLCSRIDCLPAIQARLVRMSYFEAKSHQEIAKELGLPLGTVKSHLRRAFLSLQRSVRGRL